MTDLVSHVIYSQFVRFGRNQSLEQITEVIRILNFDDEQVIKNAYDFACDLYDENESNGANDEMYPYRHDVLLKHRLVAKVRKAMDDKMRQMIGYIDDLVDNQDEPGAATAEFNIDEFIKDLNNLI